MLDLSSIMVGSANPKKLAEFYQKVIGKMPDWVSDGWFGFQAGSIHLTIGPHSEVKGKAKEPQRLILNLETSEVKEEFERIKEIEGVKVVKEPYGMTAEGKPSDSPDAMWIATFADPDGNYFQLMSPWDSGKN